MPRFGQVMHKCFHGLLVCWTKFSINLFGSIISEEHGGVVLAEALQVMLWDSRQHDMQRVSAFVKRLSTKSLHIGPAEGMAGKASLCFFRELPHLNHDVVYVY